MSHRFLREILLGKKRSLSSIHVREDIKRGADSGFTENMDKGKVNIIAEIKKASPSRGMINGGLDVAAAAAVYGSFPNFISGISVLTEEIYFKGDRKDILEAGKAAALPILRKDFIFSKKQVHESATLGADCILLIKPLLGLKKLEALYKYARSLGLDVLVEVHSQKELFKVLKIGAGLIGINNRNLKTMKVESDHIISVLEDIPADVIAGKTIVCESGIDSISYIEKLYKMGVDTFLIGTHFMASRDLEETLSRFGRGLEERGLI